MNGVTIARSPRGAVLLEPLQLQRTPEPETIGPAVEDFPADGPSSVTLFGPRGRVLALVRKTLEASRPNGADDGDGGGDSDSSLPPLRVVRTLFRSEQQMSEGVELFDRLLVATTLQRLQRVLTDLVVVRGEGLIKQAGFEECLRKLTPHNPQERFVELVSLARGRAIDGMPLQRKASGLSVVHVSNSEERERSFAQYRFYQTEGPPIVLVWGDEERMATIFQGPRGAAISKRLANVELTELNTLLGMVWNSLGSPKQMERLGYLESHLIKMEVLNLYHPGRFRPEFFDQLWRFSYLVRMMGSLPTLDGGLPSPVLETYQLLRSEIGAALPSP